MATANSQAFGKNTQCNSKILKTTWVAALGVTLCMPVVAQDLLEEIVVTGTRKQGVTPTETLSPVDVLGSTAISEQASFDMTEALSKLSPSLNTQRFPIADGTSFIRPVTLRNLSPDQTLVLVNGTRRHRSALVNLQLAPLGTVNQGAQAVDFSAIPAAAIKRVEVLRDGASAQYGSDAIAGVVNVILKDASEGFSVSTQYGEYFEGDGERFTISGNGGVALGADGFLNATVEYSTSDITSRGNARPDAEQVAGVVGADQVAFDGLGQRWGDPEVEALKFFVNSAIPLGDSVEIYGNASYMDNETKSGFFYRGPVLDPSEQFAARSTLQADADENFLPDPAPQALIDDILGQGLDPNDYLVPDAASGSGFVLRNPIFTQFPGGYNPEFGADLADYAVVLGIRGDIGDEFTWDVTARTAENEVEYQIANTINPSLGRLSPTQFTPGTLAQEETSLNVDFVKTFANSPFNLAFGLEFRNETYSIEAGDAASIQAGPTAAVFGVGSDGFQGFPEDSAGEFESDSYAAYVDVETDFTDELSAAVALRFEDYEQFDTTLDWKVSARYQFIEEFALRATVNTGFRAPTPGQVNTLNVTTTATSTGELVPSGTYPVDNPIAQALGSTELGTEESLSYTLGLVYQPFDNTSVTLDFYNITIDDRLALLSNTIDAVQVAELTAAGVPNAALLEGSSASFFTNAFDSEIQGIDLVVNTNYALGEGLLTLDWRHSYNEQEVTSVRAGTLDAGRIFDLENQVPNHRSVFTVDFAQDFFTGLVRFNYFAEWETTPGQLSAVGDASDAETYDGALLVDLEARFKIGENFSVTVGGDNVFDQLPDDELDGTLRFLGVEDSLTSPYGFNGGFWYVRLDANF